jgi:hypothetical protein
MQKIFLILNHLFLLLEFVFFSICGLILFLQYLLLFFAKMQEHYYVSCRTT